MPTERDFQFDCGAEVDRYFDASSQSNGAEPRIVIVMGGIASGKTTVRKQRFSTGYVLVDAAEVFRSLSRGEYFDFPGPFEELLDTIGPLIARRAIDERRHIVTELIGAEFEPIKALADAMRAIGYRVEMQAITCDVDEAQRRNLSRGDDNISAYYAEQYQLAWLHNAAIAARGTQRPPLPADTAVDEQWKFRSLVDYYDFNKECLTRHSSRLSLLSEERRDVALSTIRQRVAAMAAALDDDWLSRIAVSLSDDLYKSLCAIQRFGPIEQAYVATVWGTFFSVLTDRGFAVRYVIDNQFPDHLGRPLELFPAMFPPAGFVYLCPHQVALYLPEAAQCEPTTTGLRPLVQEARYMAARAADRANRERRHLVYLEIDYDKGCLEPITGLSADPGSILIFRNEAGVAGTKIQMEIIPKATQ